MLAESSKMAQVVGEAGRYAKSKEESLFIKFFVVFMLMAIGVGIATGLGFAHLGSWWAWFFIILEFVIFVGGLRFVDKFMDKRKAWQDGATGEREVAKALDALPDSYCIVHDISTEYGNLDHIVVCPKGIFAIETKRWRGTVSSDGNGGLLLNEKPAPKNPVKSLTGTIMRLKERIEPLTQMEISFIQGVIVFPISFINAKWGETGTAHCMAPERLEYYFDKWYKPRNLLKPDEVKRIARGFAAIARMEEGFDK